MNRAKDRSLRWIACMTAMAATVAATSTSVAEESKGSPTAEICGLRIVGPGYREGPDMRPFNWTPGVSMILRVVHPGGGLIAFDKDTSKIESFTDDKGTNLLTAPEVHMLSGFAMSEEISEDSKAAHIEIDGGTPPASGAKSIHVKGVAVFSVATEKKSFTDKDVKLEKGTEVKAGEVSFTITEVGKPGWGDEPLEISLKASKDITTIAGIRFLDADGKEIESSESGEMSMSMNGFITVERGYRLARKVDKLTFEITYWTNLSKINVPFDLTTGVGF